MFISNMAMAIAQLFFLVGLGAALARLHLPLVGSFEATFWKSLSTFIYRVTLPPLVFVLVSGIEWNASMFGFALTSVGVSIAIIVATIACAGVLPLDAPSRKLAMAIAHQCNSVYIGLPVLLAMIGPSAMAKGALVAILNAMISNVTAVSILSQGSGHEHPIVRVLRAWRQDPFILACVVGVIWSLLSLPRPEVVMKPLEMVGGLAPPLAMIVVGTQLRFAFGDLRAVAMVTALRLVLAPMILIAVLFSLNTHADDRLLLILQLSTPLATSIVPLVSEYTRDERATETTATAVTVSTLASFLTLPILVLLFS